MGRFSQVKTLLVVKDQESTSNLLIIINNYCCISILTIPIYSRYVHLVPKKITQQIIVGTPGKLLDLINKETLKTNKIKVFVLDEADVMIDQQGLGDQSILLKK